MQCITHIGIIGEWRNHGHRTRRLVISYNPGYQSLMKDLKQSTKQRFGGLDFDYPETASYLQCAYDLFFVYQK
jgi:hypothetical protein